MPSLENSVKSAIAGGVDAVTVIALGADPEEIDCSLLQVESGSVPLVCISTGALSRPIPHVFYDNQSTGYEAAQELLRQGHTEILFFAAGLLGMLLASDCGHSSQSLSSEDKARFGYVGMPMPPEAQKYTQQHQTGTSQPAAPPAAK